MKLSSLKKRSPYLIRALIASAILSISITLGFWGTVRIKKTDAQTTATVSTLSIVEQEAIKNGNITSVFKERLTTLATLPGIKTLLHNLAQISAYAKKDDLTFAFLTVAYTIDTHDPNILISLAQAYAQREQPDKVLEMLHSLSQVKQPLSENLLLQTSRLYSEIGSLQEALIFAEKATIIHPDNPIALAHVGNMHNRLGNLDKAIAYYQKALAIKNDIPNIIYNLGYTLKRQGKLQEALSYFDRAISLKPGYLDAIIDRAYTYWALGDFERAWKDYAWRFKMHDADPTTTLPLPLWNGCDLKGKTILLYAEQGLGDTIQFIRFAESVKKYGNPKIICKVQKPLVKVLQSYPYIDKLVTTYETQGVDYQAPLMSLPGILKLTPATIPAPKTYLSADKKLIHYWQKKLSTQCEPYSSKTNSTEFRVGLCWHVDPIHEKDKSPVSRRSISLKDFLPLGDIPQVSFYALQQGKGLEEINTLPETFNLTAFDPYFDKRHGSFMDSAAVIANMDLVITVDTAIAHLAGALGKEVWILLPFSPDGRWSQNTQQTPWYPTATLFRQTKPSDWKTPLKEIEKRVRQRAAEQRKIS